MPTPARAVRGHRVEQRGVRESRGATFGPSRVRPVEDRGDGQCEQRQEQEGRLEAHDPRLRVRGSRAEGDVESLTAAVALQLDFHGVAGLVTVERVRDVAGLGNRVPVHGEDHVACP